MRPAVLFCLSYSHFWFILKSVRKHKTLKAEPTPVSRLSQQDCCPFAHRDSETNCFIKDTVDWDYYGFL